MSGFVLQVIQSQRVIFKNRSNEQFSIWLLVARPTLRSSPGTDAGVT
jgi:hypothetical protein